MNKIYSKFQGFFSFFQFHETNNFGNLFEILKIESANRRDKFLGSPGLLRISELSPISIEHENHWVQQIKGSTFVYANFL